MRCLTVNAAVSSIPLEVKCSVEFRPSTSDALKLRRKMQNGMSLLTLDLIIITCEGKNVSRKNFSRIKI